MSCLVGDLKVCGAKILLDGSASGRTAWRYEDYPVDARHPAPTGHGFSTIEPDVYKKMVLLLFNDAGVSVGTQCDWRPDDRPGCRCLCGGFTAEADDGPAAQHHPRARADGPCDLGDGGVAEEVRRGISGDAGGVSVVAGRYAAGFVRGWTDRST